MQDLGLNLNEIFDQYANANNTPKSEIHRISTGLGYKINNPQSWNDIDQIYQLLSDLQTALSVHKTNLNILTYELASAENGRLLAIKDHLNTLLTNHQTQFEGYHPLMNQLERAIQATASHILLVASKTQNFGQRHNLYQPPANNYPSRADQSNIQQTSSYPSSYGRNPPGSY